LINFKSGYATEIFVKGLKGGGRGSAFQRHSFIFSCH